jgi:hypothetical protein
MRQFMHHTQLQKNTHYSAYHAAFASESELLILQEPILTEVQNKHNWEIKTAGTAREGCGEG